MMAIRIAALCLMLSGCRTAAPQITPTPTPAGIDRPASYAEALALWESLPPGMRGYQRTALHYDLRCVRFADTGTCGEFAIMGWAEEVGNDPDDPVRD